MLTLFASTALVFIISNIFLHDSVSSLETLSSFEWYDHTSNMQPLSLCRHSTCFFAGCVASYTLRDGSDYIDTGHMLMPSIFVLYNLTSVIANSYTGLNALYINFL